jgi:hypothetical protein
MRSIRDLDEAHIPRDECVLEIVHRVGDVIRPIHDLGLKAPPPFDRAFTQPGEDLPVIVIDAELVIVDARVPRILRRGIEGCAGEVESDGSTIIGEALGLKTRQDAQALGIAFETATGDGRLGERGLAVVAEGRMAQVVRKARRLDQIGVGAEGRPEFTTDLASLE